MPIKQNTVEQVQERLEVGGQRMRKIRVMQNLPLILKVELIMKNMSILYVHQWKNRMSRMRILAI